MGKIHDNRNTSTHREKEITLQNHLRYDHRGSLHEVSPKKPEIRHEHKLKSEPHGPADLTGRAQKRLIHRWTRYTRGKCSGFEKIMTNYRSMNLAVSGGNESGKIVSRTREISLSLFFYTLKDIFFRVNKIRLWLLLMS